MKFRLVGALFVVSHFFSSAAGAQKSEKTLRVTVVDIAGGVIYVEPGANEGLRAGQTIKFGKRGYKVASVNSSSATLEVAGKGIPKLGAKGKARVEGTALAANTQVKPTKLAEYQNLWKPAPLPADSQTPQKIVIAMSRMNSSTEITVIGRGGITHVLSSDEDTVGHVSARTILSSQPFNDLALGIDADLEVGQWFGRSGDQGRLSRPAVQLQELRLRYGDIESPALALGRMRNASRQLGQLDGARVRSEIAGGFSVFAFGGVVPDYLDGNPSGDLARFGGGVQYADDESSLRPNAELTLYGSRFDGGMDEKRATLDMRILPGAMSLSMSSEVSLFDKSNPWGSSSVEMTFASVDSRYHKGRFSTGISLSAQQPERSRWLASLLPKSWLCTTVADPSVSEEECDGDRNYRYFALYSADYIGKNFQAQGGATTIIADELEQLALYADFRVPVRRSTLGASILMSDSEFVRSWATRLQVSRQLGSDADLTLFYRPEIHGYLASLDTIIEHRVGAEGSMSVGQDLFLRLRGETLQSSEIRYVSSFLSLVWRTGL